MDIVTRASVQVQRPPEAVFDVATDPARLPEIMKARGPIPAVTGVTVEGGGAQRVGTRRSVAMGDGSVMGEEVVAMDRPRVHGYRWLNPPKLPFSLLVRTARAEWTFTPAGGGTRVDWVYTFELTSPLVYPFAALVVALFRGWMDAALKRIGPALGD